MKTNVAYKDDITGAIFEPGDNTIRLGNKSVRLSLSQSAARMLSSNETQPHVDIELELYFSCLIRKRVNVRAQSRPDTILSSDVTRNLSISFRPVTTKFCRMSDVHGEPDIESMPIKDPGRFVPKWVSLDYRHGQWTGEYGF